MFIMAPLRPAPWPVITLRGWVTERAPATNREEGSHDPAPPSRKNRHCFGTPTHSSEEGPLPEGTSARPAISDGRVRPRERACVDGPSIEQRIQRARRAAKHMLSMRMHAFLQIGSALCVKLALERPNILTAVIRPRFLR